MQVLPAFSPNGGIHVNSGIRFLARLAHATNHAARVAEARPSSRFDPLLACYIPCAAVPRALARKAVLNRRIENIFCAKSSFVCYITQVTNQQQHALYPHCSQCPSSRVLPGGLPQNSLCIIVGPEGLRGSNSSPHSCRAGFRALGSGLTFPSAFHVGSGCFGVGSCTSINAVLATAGF